MGDEVTVDVGAVEHELRYALRQIDYAGERTASPAALDALDRARQAIDAALSLVRPVPDADDDAIENEF